MGNDDNTWIVKENINGVKRWARHQDKPKSKSKSKSKGANKKESAHKIKLYDFYNIVHVTDTKFKNVVNNSTPIIKKTLQKLNKFVKDVCKLGKLTDIIPLPLSKTGQYWVDYPHDYITDKYNDKYRDSKTICILS